MKDCTTISLVLLHKTSRLEVLTETSMLHFTIGRRGLCCDTIPTCSTVQCHVLKNSTLAVYTMYSQSELVQPYAKRRTPVPPWYCLRGVGGARENTPQEPTHPQDRGPSTWAMTLSYTALLRSVKRCVLNVLACLFRHRPLISYPRWSVHLQYILFTLVAVPQWWYSCPALPQSDWHKHASDNTYDNTTACIISAGLTVTVT